VVADSELYRWHVFNSQERKALRRELLAAARQDERISGAALTGSAALDREDNWSDIDLAFGVSEGNDVKQVISDWTVLMYENHGAVHHMDMASGDAVYRVFLLENTLQVDLAFSPARSFGAIAPSFRLVFGTSQEVPQTSWSTSNELIGVGWLYALHARSSIARSRVWQAEYMISGFRYQALALACIRYGVSPNQGRGLDSLPSEITEAFVGALVRSLDGVELKRAFQSTGEMMLREISFADSELANRLTNPLRELVS
jgi:hypothetical protein